MFRRAVRYAESEISDVTRLTVILDRHARRRPGPVGRSARTSGEGGLRLAASLLVVLIDNLLRDPAPV